VELRVLQLGFVQIHVVDLVVLGTVDLVGKVEAEREFVGESNVAELEESLG
jgi:hypothetical protein